MNRGLIRRGVAPVLGLWLMLSALAVSAALPSSPPPVLSARAWLLLDVTSGSVLAEQHADKSVEPASMTKLMTAYLGFAALRDRSLSLTQAIPVSDAALKVSGARMFLSPAVPATVEDLLKGLIVASANDAAIALAEAVAGSEAAFVQAMNKEARRLGMNQTHFMNATGLPHAEHRSTARDLARLTQALLRDFPGHYPRFAVRTLSYNRVTQQNRNALLWLDPHVDGLKTGHTASAGYGVIASAKRDHRRVLSVLIGAATESARTLESQRLLNYGFEQFETLRLYSARQPVAALEVFHGQGASLAVGFLNDFYITVPRTHGPLQAQVLRREPLLAPFKQGQGVASLQVSADGRVVGVFPLQALDTMERAGWLGRLWDNLRLKYRAWMKR
jgi:serine-type D-Ala-D-Ala carboxypeptidase (penicillin-binding protein 5/6)